MIFKVLDIVRGTTVDGPGFRTSIYLSGCNHHCPGCHNPQSWNPNSGKDMTLEEILEIVKEEDFNVTLSGGDPLFYPDRTLELVKAINKEGYRIWLYTGYTIEQIHRSEEMSAVLPYLEAIVDGRFEQEKRDKDLLFRGSSNQRIIYL